MSVAGLLFFAAPKALAQVTALPGAIRYLPTEDNRFQGQQVPPTPERLWQSPQAEQNSEWAKLKNALPPEKSPAQVPQLKINGLFKMGTESGGGGNQEEADFVASARAIFDTLSEQPNLMAQTLGVDIEQLAFALKGTEVHCAPDPILKSMRQIKKKFYYAPELLKILIDCPSYRLSGQDERSKEVLIFHEYMRRIQKESSDYSVSSRLPGLLAQIKNDQEKRDQLKNELPTCKARETNGNGYTIYVGRHPIRSVGGLFSVQQAAFQEMMIAVNQLQKQHICKGFRFGQGLTPKEFYELP